MHTTGPRVPLPGLAVLAVLLSAACPGPPRPAGHAIDPGGGPPRAAKAPPTAPDVTIAVVGTSDLHGHVEPDAVAVTDQAGQPREVARGGLPLFGGYLANLRRRLPTLVLDGGDLFQGTLASNLSEGQVVIDAYNLLGYTASAIGNHEFDYGPVGPHAVPKAGTDDDPVGALKARIASARFPFLTANVIDEATGRPVAWPNTYPSRLVEVPGVPGLRVGLVGATAEDTPHTTNAMNLRGLRIDKVVPAVRAEAQALRRQGAAAVILTVHEGGDCKAFGDPRDLRACEGSEGRVLRMARELAADVDAIVGGHTHAGVAHLVGDVGVIQSFMGHRYFGRMDLTFHRLADGRFAVDRGRTRIHPPQEICSVAIAGGAPFVAGAGGRQDHCVKAHLEGRPLEPARYEGAAVTPSAEIAAAIAPYSERAAARRAEPIGVTLAHRLGRSYRAESELARLLADLIREGAEAATGQKVDAAFQNGGGIRSDLPTGELRYGDLYEVMPFDNRLALMRVPGSALTELMARNLVGSGGVLVPSGLTGEARCVPCADQATPPADRRGCAGDKLEVLLYDRAGKPIQPGRSYTIAVSDFLAAGGDNFGAILPQLPSGAVTYYDDLPPLREQALQALKRHRSIGPAASGPPRMRLPGPRPLRCGGEPASPTQ